MHNLFLFSVKNSLKIGISPETEFTHPFNWRETNERRKRSDFVVEDNDFYRELFRNTISHWILIMRWPLFSSEKNCWRICTNSLTSSHLIFHCPILTEMNCWSESNQYPDMPVIVIWIRKMWKPSGWIVGCSAYDYIKKTKTRHHSSIVSLTFANK